MRGAAELRRPVGFVTSRPIDERTLASTAALRRARPFEVREERISQVTKTGRVASVGAARLLGNAKSVRKK